VALILLTNDDGIEAEGLQCLEDSLQGLADIVVVAPDRERSAVSHGLTVRSPLEVKCIRPNRFMINGTPADCVIYSLRYITVPPPDLVISGINHGANLGDDIMYSGTVAAAREAARHGIPALAVSQAYDDKPIRFREGATFVRKLVREMLEQESNGGICLNINLPVGDIRGVKVTRQGCSSHFVHFNALDGEESLKPLTDQTADRSTLRIPFDYRAVRDHYISITPLQRDQTDYVTVKSLLRQFA